MSIQAKPLLLATAVIALGIVVGVWTRTTANTSASSAPEAAQATPMSTVADTPSSPLAATSPQRGDDGPLPWDRPIASNGPATTLPATPAAELAPPASGVGMPDAAIVQQQLRNNDRAIEQALSQLSEMEAAGTIPAQINAKAVRTNLAVAQRAQRLASEMMSLAQQPASEARTARIQVIVTELRKLESQLVPDVTRPTSGAAL